MEKRLVRLSAAAILMALATAACAGGTGRGDNQPSEPQAEATAAEAAATIEGLPPTKNRLAGIWLADEEVTPLLVRFSPDGTFAIDDGAGPLDTAPAGSGTYEVDGETIRFMNERSRVCNEGDRWTFQARLPEDGRLHTVITDDAADACSRGAGTELTWTRVSPSSPVGLQITAPNSGKEGARPSAASVLRGIWLLEGGGHLLRFGIDGTYAIDDAGRLGADPYDVGTVEADGKGTLTFISGARSRGCERGDRWVWEEVELVSGLTVRGPVTEFAGATLRGLVSTDDCREEAGMELTWVLISSV